MSAATILTLANGRGIDLLDPKVSDICFDVLGEHLAKEKRYNGATPDIEYSVAEHSCRGADAILSATGDRLLAAYFLVHDGKEHALKDMTTPLKQALAELAAERFGILASQIIDSFNLLEYRHDVAIHAAAGLPWPPPPEMAAAIKRWDLIMFVTEWRDLMRDVPHPNWAPYSGIKPLLSGPIDPWKWTVARDGFVRRCRELLPCFALAHDKTASERGGTSV